MTNYTVLGTIIGGITMNIKFITVNDITYFTTTNCIERIPLMFYKKLRKDFRLADDAVVKQISRVEFDRLVKSSSAVKEQMHDEQIEETICFLEERNTYRDYDLTKLKLLATYYTNTPQKLTQDQHLRIGRLMALYIKSLA